MTLRSPAPRSGDVWYATPTGALARREDPHNPGKFISQVIKCKLPDGSPECEDIKAQHTGGAYWEYRITPKAHVKMRPGMLCSVMNDDGRVVITPSWGTPRCHGVILPELHAELPTHLEEDKNCVRFEFCNMWGIDLDDLLYSRRSVPEPIAATAKELILGTLGLVPPRWIPSNRVNSYRSAAVFRRGEMIWFRMPLENFRVPLLVISDDAINGFDQTLLVTLRTLDYDPDHEECETIVPLHTNKNLSSNLGFRLVGKSLSVDLTMIRGIQIHNHNAGKFGCALQQKSPSILKAIDEGLRRIYG